MRAARLEESVMIAAAPERVFAWADDPANTGWHMRRRSLVMLGAALKLEQVPAAARGGGATYRWSGSVLGLTVDQPRMVVMAAFQMGLAVTPLEGGARLRGSTWLA